jgi:hypothetical protein
MLFTNKHVVVAMLVAPVLGILAWFSVDYFIGERPHAARDGASYALVARPNCRRLSDGCELVNEDFQLKVMVTSFDAIGAELDLSSVFPLSQVGIGVANAGVEDAPPTVLERADAEGKRWRGRVGGSMDADTKLRVAAIADDTTFYAEIPVTFFYATEQ